jgi:hypothetical protein
MRLEDWEVTIQEIVDECIHQEDEMSDDRILMKWRAKLEKEPTLLEPYHIDEIIREARQRLSDLSRRP